MFQQTAARENLKQIIKKFLISFLLAVTEF